LQKVRYLILQHRCWRSWTKYKIDDRNRFEDGDEERKLHKKWVIRSLKDTLSLWYF